MKELEFKFAGIRFLVYADVISGETIGDSYIDYIIGVHVWDENEKKYISISCDLDAFAHDLSDQIQEALEDALENDRLAYEDMAYDAWRENNK